jgi:zinc transporter ZupT
MDGLTLLVAATLAASLLAGASGPAYRFLTGGDRPPPLGWANAIASGLMLGAAYALAAQGWGDGPGLAFGIGAALGIAPGVLVYERQDAAAWDGTGADPVNDGPTDGYATIFRHALHAAPEGVALGVAAFGDLGLGLFLVAALAAHNVAEGLSLVEAAVKSGGSTGSGAVEAVVSNLPQVVFAAVVYMGLGAFPQAYPIGVGFGVGALVFLVLVDLLPRAYRQDGHETIALVCALAMSAVPLLAGILGF